MENNMDLGKWSETKTKIKSKWPKLNDNDIEASKKQLDLIVTKIQMAYGYNKDTAQKEFDEFKKSLLSESQTKKPEEKSAEKNKESSKAA